MAAALELGGVLVTRGEEGMSLIQPRERALHIPARAREVFDVTGAGDTVIATIGCANGARGEEGMSLIQPRERALHIPARAREVFDVTGAGDTVIATIGCANGARGEL